jgi:hypothetical protein
MCISHCHNNDEVCQNVSVHGLFVKWVRLQPSSSVSTGPLPILLLFNDVLHICYVASNGKMSANDELERICKEAVVA